MSVRLRTREPALLSVCHWQTAAKGLPNVSTFTDWSHSMRNQVLMIAVPIFLGFLSFTGGLDHLRNDPGARLLISAYFAITAADIWFLFISVKDEIDRIGNKLFTTRYRYGKA
jgi:hypothetical protein